MEDYYMVEEIAWGAERGKSFHLCLTSFCEISLDLVGWFLLVWWVVLCFGLCWFVFCFGMVLWNLCTQLAPVHFMFPVVDRLCFALARQCRKKNSISMWTCSEFLSLRTRFYRRAGGGFYSHQSCLPYSGPLCANLTLHNGNLKKITLIFFII